MEQSKICPKLDKPCIKQECALWVIERKSTPVCRDTEGHYYGGNPYTEEYCGLLRRD